MNDRASCPDRALLEAFVFNRLLPEQSRAVEDHLLDCETCLSSLEAATGLESVRQVLRRPFPHEDTREESMLRELIERGRRLHTSAPATVTPHPAAGAVAPTPHEEPGGVHPAATAPHALGAFERDVLAPPQGPGEIGRLGPYRVLELLGKGGMGAVYLAEDPHLRRRVALKTLQPLLAAEPKARERFLREARTLAALEHDHIVPIFHVGEERGVPFLAMPLLKGESLETRLKAEKKLPLSEAVRIAREAAEGLACAHAAGLIHRDVKPDNLWLEPPPRRHVKVLDFGLARPVESGQGMTEPGALMGTPGYLAPELTSGAALDGRADLFGLGVVLYRMLTGRAPYRGGSMLGYIQSLVSDSPAAPSAVEPAVPEALSRLVMQLLAREPADRPASAEALTAELTTLEQALEASGPQQGAGRLRGKPSRAADVEQGPWLPQRARIQRRWVIPAGVAALVLLALAAIAPFLPRGDRPIPHTLPATPLSGTTAAPAKAPELRMDVEHFTGDTGESCGLLGVDSFVTHFNDDVKLTVRLPRPAPSYLISFRPDGEEELVFPPDEDTPPSEEQRPRYPWRPEDRAKRYGLNDGEGLQVFAAVVLRRALPYRTWKVQRGPGPWKQQTTPRDVVWWDNGIEIERLTADDRRKGKDVAGAAPVAALADWLKKAPEVETVAALGFAVVGKKKP